MNSDGTDDNSLATKEIDAFEVDLNEISVFPFSFFLSFTFQWKSYSEFSVSTRVLRNETLAVRSYHGDDFKVSTRDILFPLEITFFFFIFCKVDWKSRKQFAEHHAWYSSKYGDYVFC